MISKYAIANFRRWNAAALILVFALVRHAANVVFGLIGAATFVLALAACLQNVGLFYVPYIGIYLTRVPVEASITLIGILLGVFGATKVWRSQKRDELLLASLAEVQTFFETAFQLAVELNGYISLLKSLQVELKAGPYSLDSYWMASYLEDQSVVMRDKLSRLVSMGTLVHTLDGRNVQALTWHSQVFHSFKTAKSSLLELIDVSHFSIPPKFDDPGRFIAYLRMSSNREFDEFLSKFSRLNETAGGALGGIRGVIQARFFPPTITLARAVFGIHRSV